MRVTKRGGGYKTLAEALRAMSQDDDSDEELDQTPSPHGQRGGPVRRGGHTSRSSMPNRLSSPPSGNRPHTTNIILRPPSFTLPDPLHGATPLTVDAPSDDPLHDVLPSPITSPSQSGSMLSTSSSVCSSLMSRIPVEIECDERLYPGNKVAKCMRDLFKEKLCPQGYTWSKVGIEVKDWYWASFKKSFTFPSEMEQRVHDVWSRHAGLKYSGFLWRLRLMREKPDFVAKTVWDSFWKEWKTSEFQLKGQKMSANRKSEVNGPGLGISVHTGGSKSAYAYAKEMTEKLGRTPTHMEVYKALHWDKKNNKWRDVRSEKIAMEVESSIASDPSLTNDSDLDQVQRDMKLNEHYCTAVGGVSKKQLLYGVGSFGASQILAGKLSRISEVDIARIREEGRAEGRAEVQQILDKYKGEVQQKFDDMDKRFELMMARINTSESTPSGCS